jgi:hypothetical protein
MRRGAALELALIDLRHLQEMPQQACLERLAAVDRDRQPYDAAGLAVNVMTALTRSRVQPRRSTMRASSRPETDFIR